MKEPIHCDELMPDKKKRREIYLRAAEDILLSEREFMCNLLANQIGAGLLDLDNRCEKVKTAFTEFALFDPNNSGADRHLWFENVHGHDTRQIRVIIILLCAEMTKDAEY